MTSQRLYAINYLAAHPGSHAHNDVPFGELRALQSEQLAMQDANLCWWLTPAGCELYKIEQKPDRRRAQTP